MCLSEDEPLVVTSTMAEGERGGEGGETERKRVELDRQANALFYGRVGWGTVGGSFCW